MQALHQVDPKAGQRALITAAAGGVGHMAVQVSILGVDGNLYRPRGAPKETVVLLLWGVWRIGEQVSKARTVEVEGIVEEEEEEEENDDDERASHIRGAAAGGVKPHWCTRWVKGCG